MPTANKATNSAIYTNHLYFLLSLLRAEQEMARGHQKIQSQAKAAEKQAKMKKQQGHSANDQKKAAQKALVHVCAVCKVSRSLHIKSSLSRH